MPIAVNDQGQALALGQDGQWTPTQMAQNPQTGERLAYDGQQWQPIQAGANPQWDTQDLVMSAQRGIPVYGGMYEQSLSPADQKRAQNFDAAHPWISTAAKLAGGGAATTAALAALPEESLLGAVLGGTYGATPLARFASSALGGATLGGADAATRGENPVTGAVLGGTLGAAAPVVSRAIETPLGLARSALSPVDRSAQVQMRVGNAPVNIFGPEAGTGNISGQQFIEQARKGAWGEKLAEQAKAADAERDLQLAAAHQEIRNSLAPAAPAVPGAPAAPVAPAAAAAAVSPLDAMGAAQQAVQNAAAQARTGYKTAYGAFDTTPGSVNTQAFSGISNQLQNQLSNLPQPLFAGPRAQAALNEFEQNLTARPGMSIQEVSRALQVLKARKDAMSPLTDGYDRGVLGNAISKFNDHLQNTLASPMYTGDQGALPALRNANALYARYQQLYGTSGADTAGGQFVQNMLKDNNITYQQMADRLYGASPKTAGELGKNIQAATRLKNILGETSPEWRTVQQGYLSHLLDDVQGAQHVKAATTILDNVFKGGRQFADVMLPPQAVQGLDQLRAITRQLTPLPGAVNYSNSAYHLGSMAHTIFTGLMALAGHHVAGPLGLIVGAGSHAAGPMITSGIKGRALARLHYGNQAAPMFAPNASASRLEKVLTRASRASSFGR